MNKIIFGNLGILDIYLRDQILISEGNELSLMGKDDYDTAEKLSSLEYPIYFTYHELLNKISYDKDLSYSKKIYYLDKIYESLDVLIQYIDDYEEESSKICFIIDNIYERYETVKSQTVYTWGEKAIFLFDDIVDSFRTARKYLYFPPPTLYPLMYLKPGEFLKNEDDSDSEESDSEISVKQVSDHENESEDDFNDEHNAEHDSESNDESVEPEDESVEPDNESEKENNQEDESTLNELD